LSAMIAIPAATFPAPQRAKLALDSRATRQPGETSIGLSR